jgi:hypothetical protein
MASGFGLGVFFCHLCRIWQVLAVGHSSAAFCAFVYLDRLSMILKLLYGDVMAPCDELQNEVCSSTELIFISPTIQVSLYKYTTSISRPRSQHNPYQPLKTLLHLLFPPHRIQACPSGNTPIRSPAVLFSHAPYRPSASWTYPHRMKPTQGKLGDAMSLDLPFPQTRKAPHWLRTHRPPPCVFAFCSLGHAKHCGDHTPVLIVMDAAMKEMYVLQGEG